MNSFYLPSRTGLLSFEPASQAMEMEDVAAGQFLWLVEYIFLAISSSFWVFLFQHFCIDNMHFFSANDASVVT